MGVLCGSANSHGGKIVTACVDTNSRSSRDLSRCPVDCTNGKQKGCAQYSRCSSSTEVEDVSLPEAILSANTIHISRLSESDGIKKLAGVGVDPNAVGVGSSPAFGATAEGSTDHAKLPEAPGTALQKSPLLRAGEEARKNGQGQQQPQQDASYNGSSREVSSVPQTLSTHALRIVSRVESIVQKCEGLEVERPTEEEKAMYEVLHALRRSSVGPLFLNHPEVSFSNRSCVICIPDFQQDEMIDGYRLRAAYNAGTIGRSYFATRDTATLSSRCMPKRSSTSSLYDDAAKGPIFRILKVISFVLRRRLLEEITAEQRVVVNIVHQNVLQVNDVLNDEVKENMIVITNYHAKGNIGNYAGRLSHDPDKLRRILTEVAVGLRILHSHRVYHHNLKLDNVLESAEGHFCIADAGFWRLFAVQCPEDLVFNGELACLPPEVFDPQGAYATGEVNVVSEEAAAGVAAVDIWGFGVLMYRLAYGCDPVEIAECSYAQVREQLMNFDLNFPPHPHWSFAFDIEDAIRLCLQKEPSKRPNIVRLLQHPFFKQGMVGGPSSLMRNMSIMSSLAFSGQMVGSFGDRTMSTFALRGASMSNVAAPTHRTQQRNGFQVDAFLGEGRFSESMMVHLRRNPSKQFTFKLISKSILKQLHAPGRESWAREMRRQLVFARKVDHPNVMRFIDIVEDKKVNCFAVQDYMSNGAIEAVPPVKGDSTSPTLQEFLVDVLAGLVHLHDNNVAHLSLVPTNIFLCEHTLRYRIADFGPLFVTVDALVDSIAEGASLYKLPSWVREQNPLHGPSVDMFFVGLLAASVLPELFKRVWAEVLDSEKEKAFDLDAVLAVVRNEKAQLTPTLISFVEDALKGRLEDARAALKHTYFENLSFVQNLPKTVLEITEEELQNAVHSKPETRDEARMVEVLAQDPFQESQMLSSVGDATLQDSESCTEMSIVTGATGEKPTVLDFDGENLRCGQCDAELTVALYQCSDCDSYIRCGKCSVGDDHKNGHELVPFLIHTIEHSRDGANKAVLVQPSTVPDVHALETLEMTANFPVGSLTAHLAAQRAAERLSAVRSTGGSGIIKGLFGDMDSVVRLPDDVSEQSISLNIHSRSFISFRGLGGTSGAGLHLGNGACSTSTGFNTASFPYPRMDSITPKDMGSLCLPPPSRLSLVKDRVGKKIALPKAAEMEDDDWQQELERCRNGNHTELQLYNYRLDEVPPDVYDPPLLQVVNLDISQNNLTSLPHELSFLIHLRKLVVSYNKLTDLPDSLGNLSELESFDASHNVLVDLPQTFIYLTYLTSVALDYNNFASIPDSLLDIVALPLCASSSNMIENLSMATPQVSGARMESVMGNAPGSFFGGSSVCNSKTVIMSPKLKVIYLAANDSLTTFPSREKLQRFDDLTIALDNEPSLYKDYYEKNLDTELPNITVNWNKLYPDEIVPYLYCGSLRSAQSQMVYRKLSITYLLTVGRQLVPVPPEGGHHKVIVVDDIPGANISQSFQEAVDFIEESQLKKSGCLVHCFAGLSRSATTVIAYLMIKRGMRLDEAYRVTKKGRPAILPNKGFFDQLVTLDKELYPEPCRPLDIESLGRSEN